MKSTNKKKCQKFKVLAQGILISGWAIKKQAQKCKDEHGQEVDCPITESEAYIGDDKMDGPTYLASWAKLSNTRFLIDVA